MSKAAHGTVRRNLGEVNNRNFRSTKFVLMVGVAFSLLIPTAAYGYSTNFDYAVQAKWTNNLNFMICIANSQGKEYEGLFIKAIDEWKARWPHFVYTISYASGCHINLHIVEKHSMLAEHGYVGYTNMEYWEHGGIAKADIILPTHKKNTITTEVKGKTVTMEHLEPLSSTQFYRAALHEFGHALNLGHFDDNGIEPIDIMYPHPADDAQEQGISQRDIQALNWYYLGFFDQNVKVRTDRKSYGPGDTVNISGRVSHVMPGKSVKLEVLDSGKTPYTSDTLKVSTSGEFIYKMKIPYEIESGSYKVEVSYGGIVEYSSIDIKNPKHAEEAPISEVREMNMAFAKIVDNVTVLDTEIVDLSGSKINSIRPHEQVFIRSSFSLAPQVEANYIIQIKNSEGYTSEISFGAYKAASLSAISHSWLPDERGIYEIQIFLWKNLSDPEPLIPNPVALEVIVV
ncbi:MAG: hypothetical protein ACE5J2_03590 [Nitrososphaerales archaeon]